MPRAVKVTSSLLAVIAAIWPAASLADEPVRELRHDLRIDVPVVVLGTALLVSLHVLQERFAASRCRWCDRGDEGKDALNPLDAGARSAALVFSSQGDGCLAR
jgi:hypothetical protein